MFDKNIVLINRYLNSNYEIPNFKKIKEKDKKTNNHDLTRTLIPYNCYKFPEQGL